MTKFRVYLVTTASTVIEVEAEDGEEAVELALESENLPYAPGFADYEFGEWTTASELFNGRPENDYDEVADDD